jgi:quercetin dioxygenase-like cupin family protein
VTERFKSPFSIFRARGARPYEEAGVMTPAELGPVATEGAEAAIAAGIAQGSEVKLVFETSGFSLTHVWFKSFYPLPGHSHDADCLYYVLAGSLRIGVEELAAGDGFFVGANTPYAYTPGADGVELLEFRAADAFDIKVLANNPAFWSKAVETAQRRQESWAAEQPPSARG